MLSLYKRTPNVNDDNTIELADKLLVSATSGSEKAKDYLINFRNRFSKLDGIYLEEYDSTIAMLNLWEKGKL